MTVKFDYYLTPDKHRVYPRPVDNGNRDTCEMTEYISEACTLHSADVMAALVAMGKYISASLKNGKSVKLDGLGTFSITLETDKHTDNVKEMHTADVHFKSIRFLPETELKDAVREGMTFQHVRKNDNRNVDEEKCFKVLMYLFERRDFITASDYKTEANISDYQSRKDLKRYVDEGILKEIKVNKKDIIYMKNN